MAIRPPWFAIVPHAVPLEESGDREVVHELATAIRELAGAFHASIAVILAVSMPRNAPVPAPRSPAPTPSLDLVDRLRKEGGPIQAAYVEYLLPRRKADFDDIKNHVHGDDSISDDAVRRRVSDTNKSLFAIGAKLKLSTKSGWVYLDVRPG